MAVDYNDSRFTQIQNDKANALSSVNSTYDQMINSSDSYYQSLINESKNYANKQSEMQQQQTDFAIEKINQEKEKAEKDYTKEQKSAYVDYQKASNQYGANAEKLASQGLTNTGYAESTKTNMFNTYQNRYASARESYGQAVLNYNNSIKEAQLANSSALAQIAYQALQEQLQLGLEQFQYKNQLIQSKLTASNDTEDRYYQRYQDVLSQINTENALAEQIREYNETLAFQKAQEAEKTRQYNETLALQKAQLAASKAKSSGGSSRSSKKSTSGSSSSTKLTDSSSSSGLTSSEKQKIASMESFYSKLPGLTNDQKKKLIGNNLNRQYSKGSISSNELTHLNNYFGI